VDVIDALGFGDLIVVEWLDMHARETVEEGRIRRESEKLCLEDLIIQL